MQKFLCIFFIAFFHQLGLASNKEPEKKDTKKEEKKDEKNTTPPEEIKLDQVDEAMTLKARGFDRTNDYVHTWLTFPEAIGKSLDGGTTTFKPKLGHITVLIFISSWNVKSQEFIPKFKEMEKLFSPYKTDFLYIFTHDTFKDANAFAKTHELSPALLGEHDINKAFHNPTVPTIYIADRHGWLLHRYIDLTPDQLHDAMLFLRKITPI